MVFPSQVCTPHRRLLAALLLAALALASCGKNDTPAAAAPPPPEPVYANRVIDFSPGTLILQGSYTDDWGGSHAITPVLWDMGVNALFHILKYSNAGEYLIAQNDSANTWNPNLFSRMDWSYQKNALYYCQIEFWANDAVTAEANTTADRMDLAAGCGGFGWTLLGAPAWAYFYAPDKALGVPDGGPGVVSLGYDKAGVSTTGGHLTLGFGDLTDRTKRFCITNGPGPDFVVYENAFRYGDMDGNASTLDPGTNNEVATVEVSADGRTWHRFPPALNSAKATLDPSRYSQLAGVTPMDEGGDAFDLEAILTDTSLPAHFQACYVRLTDGGTQWADDGNLQTDLYSSGADIDAVKVLSPVPATGLTH
ncbi:MAG: hypothetical protein OEW39_07000 [Deltaproteobacteria bacterium]|nr:hypothetical protein [Deltaproteobacteria bacterium]